MICPCGGQCVEGKIVRDGEVVAHSQRCPACGRYERLDKRSEEIDPQRELSLVEVPT